MSGEPIDDDFDDEERWGLSDDGFDDAEASAPKKRNGRIPVPDSERVREQSHIHKPEFLCAVPWGPCPCCGGPPNEDDDEEDPATQWARVLACAECDGVGYEVPVDDAAFGETIRGSDSRILILTKRYAKGLELWTGDRSRGSYRGTPLFTPEMDL